MTQENLDKALSVGKISSGLFIVTAGKNEVYDGYLASWIQQVSFEPLLLSIAMRPGRPCYDFIQENGVFCINIVGQENNGLMKPFWKGYDPNASPFESLEKRVSDLGSLILLDAMAAIECRKVSSSQPGDHELVIAEVLVSHMIKEKDKPLAHVRKSGASY